MNDLMERLRSAERWARRRVSGARARFHALPPWERIVVLASLLYVLTLSAATVARYVAQLTFAWDLGINSQSLYTTVYSGRFLFSTPDMPNNPSGNLFGVHFAPVMLLLVPIYAAFPSPMTLLIAQSMVIGGSSILVYRLARLRLSEPLSATLALVYLLDPAVQGVNWFDFHPEALLIPFALLAIYFWERKQWRWFAASFALALSTLEMSGIVMLGLGLFWLLSSFRPRDWRAWIRRRETWLSASVCLIGAVWTVGSLAVIFHVNPGLAQETAGTWRLVGATSIYQLPLKLLTNPLAAVAAFSYDGLSKAVYVAAILGPVLFLPFRKPLTLIMLAPWFLAALTSTRPSFYTIGNQYPAFLIPFVFYGAILGLEAIAREWRRPPERPVARTIAGRLVDARNRPVVAFGVVAIAFFVLASPLSPLVLVHYETGRIPAFSPHVSSVWSVVGLVPQTASVLTQNGLFPYFANRADSYVVPVAAYLRPGNTFNGTLDDYIDRVDYVLVDLQLSLTEAAAVLTRPRIRTDFGVLAWTDGLVLLRKGYTGAPAIESLLCCSSPAVFDSRSLTLVEGLRVADPGSVSGIVLMHPKGGGVNFWTGTDILLWPAEYNVTLRIRVDSTVSGPLVTVSEVVWPFVTHVQGEDASGAGHAVSVTEEPEPCNITLSATVVNPGTLPASLGYTDVTIQFRADVFGLYRFPGTWPTSGANLYLDRVTLRPAAPLGYYRALSCP